MLSGMTNNSKVKKCLIVGTHLSNGKVHQGEGGEQGNKKKKKKKPTPQQRSLMELTLGKKPML